MIVSMKPICYTERAIKAPMTPELNFIQLYLKDDVIEDGYLVKAYNSNPKEGCAHAFATYEEARACYLDALLVLTSKGVNFRQVADIITHPPYHPELNL